METHKTRKNVATKWLQNLTVFSSRARSVFHPPARLAARATSELRSRQSGADRGTIEHAFAPERFHCAVAVRRVEAEQPPVLHVREDPPVHQRRDRPDAALKMRGDLPLGLPVFRSCAFGGAVHSENVFDRFRRTALSPMPFIER